LPGLASADGGTKPHPPRPAAGGIWVPQGSPILGTTYGGDGQSGLSAGTYGRGNVQCFVVTDSCGPWTTVVSTPNPR
jgi:hypothetical protein